MDSCSSYYYQSYLHLHESVSHHNGNVGSAVSVRPHAQLPEVLLSQVVRGLPQVHLEHVGPAMLQLVQSFTNTIISTSHEHLEGQCKFFFQIFS